MKKFLTQVAEYIIQSQPEGLQDLLLCVPNNRSGYHLIENLSALLSPGTMLPEVKTIEQWLIECSKKTVGHHVALLNLLYKAYTECGGSESFDSFIPTAQVMLADFDELDRQLVNPHLLFKDLNDIKSLKTFLDDEETLLTEYSRSYREFWKIFRDCYFRMTDLLKGEGLIYEGLGYRQVAENVQLLDDLPYNKIYFVGFSGLSKSEQKVVRYLLDTNKAVFLVDTDPYYMSDIRQEAGNFFREYKKSWRLKSLQWEHSYLKNSARNMEVIGVARNVGQAKVTADILQNKLHLSSSNLSDTVVVLPDERLLQPLLNSLPDTFGKVNVTMGIPVAYTLLNDFVKLLHRLQNNTSGSSNLEKLRFYQKDVVALLQHKYFKYLCPQEENISDALRYIRSLNKISVTRSELLNWLGENNKHAAVLFNKVADSRSYLRYIRETTGILIQGISEKVRQEDNEDENDLEVLSWFLLLIKNLTGQFDQFESVWDIKSVQKLVEAEMRNAQLPFESQPGTGLQVMGLMETRCLDFRNVILLSVNEGIIPSSKSITSFFPYDLRKGGVMSTHKERDAMAAYLFYRLIQRAENVFLLYNTESDVLGGGEKSRFILQLKHELARLPNISYREQNFVNVTKTQNSIHPVSIKKTADVLSMIRKQVEEKGLSPTALNSYIHCSLQFYFRYILGLKEEGDVEESMEASTIGSAVHFALENIFSSMLGAPMRPAEFSKIISAPAIIENLIKKYLSNKFDEESLSQGKNYLLLNVCKALVLNFLKNEQQRISSLETRGIQAIILKLEAKLERRIVVNSFDIRIHGNTDRIEKIEDTIAISDYKTGDAKKGKIKIDNMEILGCSPEYSKAFQLMIYVWLYNGSHNGQSSKIKSGIYWLRHSQGKYEALMNGNSEIIDDAALNTFESTLIAVLQGLTDSGTPFNQTDDQERCRHCEFIRICQRD